MRGSQAETFTAGIDDAVRADSQLSVGKPDIAPPVVPGSEHCGGGSSTYPRAAAQKRARGSGSLQSTTSWNRTGIVLPSAQEWPGRSQVCHWMPPALPCPMAVARLEPERIQLPACSAQRRRTDRLYRQRHDLHDVTRAPRTRPAKLRITPIACGGRTFPSA